MKTAAILLKIFLFGSVCGDILLQDILKPGVLIQDDIMMSENEDPWDRRFSSEDANFKRWPEGIVPYAVNKSEYTLLDLYIIQEGLEEIERDTCVRFVPRSDETDYVYITPMEGCWSYLGRRGSGQVLSLSVPHCMNRGTVIHEFMHALGFWHEHSRPDRDEHIEVLWDNIVNEEKQVNFAKQIGSWQSWTDFPYDYLSVMHYSAYTFSKLPGLPTIRPKKAQVRLKDLGRAKAVGTLTDLDRYKINAYYEC